MPRQARLDVPGALHDVILRGRERGRIVADQQDREAFVARLGAVATATGTTLYAWALLPHHAHLLLRSGPLRDAARPFPRRGGAPARGLHLGGCEGGRASGATIIPLSQQRPALRGCCRQHGTPKPLLFPSVTATDLAFPFDR
jgi:hypothetical protein